MSEKLVLLVLLGIVVGMLHVIAFWRRKAGEAAYAAARSASREDERGRYCRMAVMAGRRQASAQTVQVPWNPDCILRLLLSVTVQ